MPIGLYHDFALGSERYGADGWLNQEILAFKADCGAPPDALGPEGQNWGISPLDPLRLRANGYRYFIELLRNNLRYGGAIRIDHVMALFRLFWIPRGLPPAMGTYVHYRDDELLAILALESVRAKAVVIGEDLGTVPDWVRDRLRTAGVFSYRVFYFEREHSGSLEGSGTVSRSIPRRRHNPRSSDIETGIGKAWILKLDPRWAFSLRRRLGMRCGRSGIEKRQGILAALKSQGLLPPGVSEDPAHDADDDD